jgi:hypothetical protein
MASYETDNEKADQKCGLLPLFQAIRQLAEGAPVPFVAVIRAQRPADDGVILRIDGYRQSLSFARRWRQRHPDDRVSILSEGLIPLVAFDHDDDAGGSPSAQAGSDAPGTQS